MASQAEIRRLATAKLKSSGLDMKVAKQLGVQTINGTVLRKMFPHITADVSALKLQYYDINGKERKGIYRVRLLESIRGPLGTTLSLRYLQPAGTPPAAYLPRGLDWKSIAEDPENPIIITEGELKAACVSHHLEQACIGIGGVANWQSHKRGWDILPELKTFEWEERDVVIVFDADSATNPDVARATLRLSDRLSDLGACVRVANLPEVSGDPKTGIDDFIVAEGTEAALEVLEAAKIDELSKALVRFNMKYAFVTNPGIVVDLENFRNKYKPSEWKNSIIANEWAIGDLVDSRGNVKRKSVQVGKHWLEWKNRQEYDRLTYAPGQPRVLDTMELNEWEGLGVDPVKGNVKLWKTLLDQLFVGSSVAHRKWFEQWLLYPLKNPGIKMDSTACIWSHVHGIGKSLVGKTLKRVYGRNAIIINQNQLEDSFNGWAVGKQFVMVDDVSGYNSRSKADVLKTMITQEEFTVNIKCLPTYEMPDYINYLMTSNQPDAWFVEPHDRRYFIFESVAQKPTKKFFENYHKWLDKGGPGALLYYAQVDMDFTGFDPHAEPPMTLAKEKMVGFGSNEISQWARDVLTEPERYLSVAGTRGIRDLYTLDELMSAYERVRKGAPPTKNRMKKSILSALPAVLLGDPVTVGGEKEVFYAVRNQDKWMGASRTQIKKYVETEYKKLKGFTEEKREKF